MSNTIKFKPFIPPVFDASCIIIGKHRALNYQLQVGSDIRSTAKLAMNSIWGEPLSIIKRSPPSLKLLARNVLLKHRPHKDWVEFCSYPKPFRDSLIDPLMVEIITPQLLVKAHPA